MTDKEREYKNSYNREWYLRHRTDGYLNKVHLSKEDRRYIVEHSADMYTSEIAAYIGCNPSTVRFWQKRLDIAPYKGKGKKWKYERALAFITMYCNAADLEEVARAFDVSVKRLSATVCYVSKMHNIKYKRKSKKLRT